MMAEPYLRDLLQRLESHCLAIWGRSARREVWLILATWQRRGGLR